MKNISLWAKNHVLITRVIISFMHALLTLIAFYLSKSIQINFSFSALIFIGLIILVVSLLYPFAKKISYTFQKIILFITSACFFLITCFFFKNNFSLPYFQKTVSAVSLPADSVNKTNRTVKKSEKHFLKKELRKDIKAYKKIPKAQRPTAQDALLIFLIVLAGIGLLFGLSILVCGISCGGLPAITIILLFTGIGGIGIGLYFIIQKLHKNIESERRKSTEKSTGYTKNILPVPVMF